MDEDITLPPNLFTCADLERLGISRNQLRRLISQRKVRRLVLGGYVSADVEDTVELRAQLVAMLAPPNHVIRDRTAAWIHGIDVFTYAEHDVPPPIETCALRGNQPSTRDGVDGRTCDLKPRDVMVIGGLRVTTPLRTALDLGCLLRRREAMAALDAFARVHGLTRQQMESEARRYRRRRGVIQLRELIALVDPRAESARESWVRLAIHDAGFPAPELQFWIQIDGVPTSGSTTPTPAAGSLLSTTAGTPMSAPRSSGPMTSSGASGCATTAGSSLSSVAVTSPARRSTAG